jgi:hypothetical protein
MMVFSSHTLDGIGCSFTKQRHCLPSCVYRWSFRSFVCPFVRWFLLLKNLVCMVLLFLPLTSVVLCLSGTDKTQHTCRYHIGPLWVHFRSQRGLKSSSCKSNHRNPSD